jgi:hypothetical protein
VRLGLNTFYTFTLVVRLAMEPEELVTIPISRLRRLEELEALESQLPTIIAKAKEDAHAERFASLRARDKADPQAHVKRTMEWYTKNKDEINAKRREKYKAQKAAATAVANSPR